MKKYTQNLYYFGIVMFIIHAILQVLLPGNNIAIIVKFVSSLLAIPIYGIMIVLKIMEKNTKWIYIDVLLELISISLAMSNAVELSFL